MPNLSPLAALSGGITRLRHSALISASGQDAVTFLHGQLTNDIQGLKPGNSCLAGYCTPKGRLLATMLVWHSDDAVMLLVPQELQPDLQKRLQMFVMRAQVKFGDVSASTGMLGIIGQAAIAALASWFPSLPEQPLACISNAHGTLLRLADGDGLPRYQWIGPRATIDTAWPALSVAAGELSEHDWALSEIHSGIPQITLATREKFVPQMVNFELLGGVNFKKGCYPGQEIVARSHYLGKQKRRTVLARIADAAVVSGVEVFCSDDPSQPCGTVVNAAPNHAGGSDCLIEIKTALLHQAPVTLQSGAVCHWLDLPYALPDEAVTNTIVP